MFLTHGQHSFLNTFNIFQILHFFHTWSTFFLHTFKKFQMLVHQYFSMALFVGIHDKYFLYTHLTFFKCFTYLRGEELRAGVL